MQIQYNLLSRLIANFSVILLVWGKFNNLTGSDIGDKLYLVLGSVLLYFNIDTSSLK